MAESLLTGLVLYVKLRCAMRKRGICCRPVSVCLSVCLSVCQSRLVDCIHTAKDTVKLLARPGSPIIIVL